MRNHPMDPDRIRARIRRALDPCTIDKAQLWQGGEMRCTLEVWRYRKSSFSTSLTMALSGITGGDGASERALVVGRTPDGITVGPEDELIFPDGARMRILSASPWPCCGTPAILTLNLMGAD